MRRRRHRIVTVTRSGNHPLWLWLQPRGIHEIPSAASTVRALRRHHVDFPRLLPRPHQAFSAGFPNSVCSVVPRRGETPRRGTTEHAVFGKPAENGWCGRGGSRGKFTWSFRRVRSVEAADGISWILRGCNRSHNGPLVRRGRGVSPRRGTTECAESGKPAESAWCGCGGSRGKFTWCFRRARSLEAADGIS